MQSDYSVFSSISIQIFRINMVDPESIYFQWSVKRTEGGEEEIWIWLYRDGNGKNKHLYLYCLACLAGLIQAFNFQSVHLFICQCQSICINPSIHHSIYSISCELYQLVGLTSMTLPYAFHTGSVFLYAWWCMQTYLRLQELKSISIHFLCKCFKILFKIKVKVKIWMHLFDFFLKL